MTREDKVNEFRRAGNKKNFPEGDNEFGLILRCIDEEFREFVEAANDYRDYPSVKEARANLCKEWADLQYVVSQAALYFDIPADPSFNRVHASNMTKVVDGKLRLREDGKILKPDTYRAPDMSGL